MFNVARNLVTKRHATLIIQWQETVNWPCRFWPAALGTKEGKRPFFCDPTHANTPVTFALHTPSTSGCEPANQEQKQIHGTFSVC
jgi:hypothetical protein